MKIWYIIAIALLVFAFIKRANLVSAWANIQFHKGENEKALEIFELADKIGNMSPKNLWAYGYMLLRQGRPDDARTVLTRASLSVSKPQIKNPIKSLLALVEWKSGNLPLAIEMLEDIIAEYRTTAIYQNLGLLYVLSADKEKALKFNLEAYDFNSEDMIIMDNLAETYAMCGETEKAEEIYEKLISKEPHFPEAYYGYGLLLVEKGEREKGIEFLRESLDKRFSFLSVKTRDEIEEMLEKIILDEK